MALQISNNSEQLEQLNFFNSNFDTIKTNIYGYNIKNYNKILFKIKDNMMLIFNDFVKTPTKDNLFNISRSVILQKFDESYKVVAFTHPIIDYNNLNKLENFKDKKFVECYEGTLISIYYSNDKWNYSTRKCLNASDSHWSHNGVSSIKSHLDMFVESIGNLENFESKLEKTKSYYFVLVHHENKIFINYEDKFGKEYKKAFLLFTRDENMRQINSSENIDEYNSNTVEYTLDEIKNKIETDQNIMGYLVNDNGQFYVYHTKFYSNLEKASPYAASLENMFIELYKQDNLDEHFKQYPANIKYRNTNFDTKGVMYGVFTYLSMSLLNLYYYFNSFDGTKLSHRNADDYKLILTDKNYTLQSLLFKMKGLVMNKNKKLELSDIKKMLKYYINSNDIIRCLNEFEEVKLSNNVVFKKMNPKYNDNAILKEYTRNIL
jgi:hypothetical protein